MNSIFLRIYGGMLAVLVLVALLGAGGLQLLNEVRADRHREVLASGTFRLMAHNMQKHDAYRAASGCEPLGAFARCAVAGAHPG